MTTPEPETTDITLEWAIVELMGHRRLAGYVSEQSIAGKGFIRLDIPAAAGQESVTQLYSPQAVYCLTPCDEATARVVAGIGRASPVQRWELPAAKVDDDPEGPDDDESLVWRE